MDLSLNNLQWLICHKAKPNQTEPGEGGQLVVGEDYLMQELLLHFRWPPVLEPNPS